MAAALDKAMRTSGRAVLVIAHRYSIAVMHIPQCTASEADEQVIRLTGSARSCNGVMTLDRYARNPHQ